MESLNLKNETYWPALMTKSARKKSIVSNSASERQDNTSFSDIKVDSSSMQSSEFRTPNAACAANHNQIVHNDSNPNLVNTQIKSDIADNRTREQILLDRKRRRNEKKTAARILKYEEMRLKNIEHNKSKTISIIDRETMNNMLSIDSNKSCPTSYFNINDESACSKTFNSAKHIKINDPMKIEISSILKSKHVKTKLNPVMRQEQESISGNYLDSDRPQLQRGKKYENKPKPLTKLKKIVLQARQENKIGHINDNSPTIKAHDENPEIQEGTIVDNLNVELQKIFISKNCEETSQNKGEISAALKDNSDGSSLTELKVALRSLITTLFGFQDRAYKKNPIKANMRRRYVAGFREVLKSVKLNNVCMILLASDIEKINCEGGIMDIIKEIYFITSELGVPVMCALKRREIGYLTHKKVGVSCLAILNKDGAEELFKVCLECNSRVIHNNKYLKLIDIKDGEKYPK